MIRALWDKVTDPDRIQQAAMSSLIDAAGVKYALDIQRERYVPGQPLKLLLAGYMGTRNTGSDLRVEELIRQLRTIVGDDQLQLSCLTVDPALTAGYFRTVQQLRLPPLFVHFLFEECPKHHGVIACEGSMFKSKFANALSTMMAGALGMASAEGKLSVGYGAEAGEMDESLTRFVRKHVQQSLVICRNEPSRRILEGLGIRTKGGTDTAWTFDPAAPEVGARQLRDAGWDGKRPVLIVCPINPFCWPAGPDLLRAAALGMFGEFKAEHFRSVYFHSWSDDRERRYHAYLDALARGVREFVKDTDAFVACVGMEALDRNACEELAQRLPFSAPLFISDQHDMYTLVSILRQAHLLVSSRFHAMVSSMPGGVPAVGVTMDERIQNLLQDSGHTELLLRVSDTDLPTRLIDTMRVAWRERDRLRHDNRRFVPSQLEKLAQMGMDFEDELMRVYPEFPRRNVTRTVENYLPKLSPNLIGLMEAHA
ncbi:MAG TPA: polysaccharide pyruvyl transferase family protein [Polyangiales bacterium]|nr:polysaccharide pyruvyl transferase family protein [Polyangiales bacterium]